MMTSVNVVQSKFMTVPPRPAMMTRIVRKPLKLRMRLSKRPKRKSRAAINTATMAASERDLYTNMAVSSTNAATTAMLSMSRSFWCHACGKVHMFTTASNSKSAVIAYCVIEANWYVGVPTSESISSQVTKRFTMMQVKLHARTNGELTTCKKKPRHVPRRSSLAESMAAFSTSTRVSFVRPNSARLRSTWRCSCTKALRSIAMADRSWSSPPSESPLGGPSKGEASSNKCVKRWL
mmetsp:Transcript_118677/g.335675  ORF Transcript_118677/g.335675 Transcript_118677/m.335675 type:complete len:236 (-) Transcript_118677:341-1048(-)